MPTTYPSHLFLSFFGCCLLALLAACSAVSGPATTAAPTTTATPTIPASTPTPPSTSVVITSPIVGTYTVTITQRDVASMPALTVEVGKWTVTLSKDGSDQFLKTDPTTGAVLDVVYGTYQVSPGQASFTDAVCPQLYGPDASTGTYHWTLQGKTLILRAKVERCPNRQGVLTSHPLLRA